MVGSKNRTCSMFWIVFLDQCYPMETEASKLSINKTNDLLLNLTPENVTQHSRIVTTTHKGSSTPTKMSKIIGRQIHWNVKNRQNRQKVYWVLVWEIGPANNTTRCTGLSKHRLPHAWHPSQLTINLSLDKSKWQIQVTNPSDKSM